MKFKSAYMLCIIMLNSLNIFADDNQPTPPVHRVALYAQSGLGGGFNLGYEHRFNDIMALESGISYGENFISTRLNRIHYVGSFVSANIYFTKPEATHSVYVSPRLSLAWGRAVISIPQDSIHVYALAIIPSVFAVYRYRFSFNLTLEAGLGIDALSTIFPLSRAVTNGIYSFPVPKFQFGFGYAF